MPHYQVTAPDGHIYEMDLPDNATPEQLDSAAREITGQGKSYPVHHNAAPPPPPSIGQQLLDNTKNDVAGVVQGRAALLDMAATGTGKVMSTVPTALGYGADALGFDKTGSYLHGIARSLANPPTIGGAIENIAPTPNTTGGKINRFIGQMVGGAATPMSGIESVVSRFVGDAPKASIVDKVAPSIVQDANQANVRLMTSDVRPPKTFVGKFAQATGERIPIAGTGLDREAQQVQRVAAVKSLAQDFGAATGDELASPAIDGVAKDLATRRGATLTKLTNQKNAVIEGIPGAVSAPNAIQAIDEQIAKLSGINETAYAPVISKLQSFREKLASGKTLSQIEGNRKLLGDMFADPSLAAIRSDGQKALSAIYGPLRDDMGAFIQANGKPADFTRWQSANDALAGMVGDLKNTGLKKALNTADTTPENVSSLLFSAKPSDVRLLYSGLSPAGRAKAQAAILQRAVEKAGGMDNISPAKFATQVHALGKSVGVFFQADDLARVQGLTRVLKMTQRAADASLAPPTGVQAMPYAIGAGFTSLFGIVGGIGAAGATGLLARAYESAPVRNALLRLGQSKPGSAEEGALIKRAIAAMSAAVQKHSPAASALNDNFMRTGAAVASPDQGPDQQQ